MIDVSVIIINYNTSSLVQECIRSIRTQTQDITYEIIIVDNNSDDNQKRLLRFLNNVKLIELPQNIGFGRANNIGIQHAKGNNIFFLNPDTILISNAIKILNDYLIDNPLCGACGGNLYDKDLEPTHSHNINYPGFFEETDQAFKRNLSKLIFGKSTLFNYGKHPMKVAYVTGADLMVKKAILDKIGCFDPLFFMYYEETELEFRIRKKGFFIYNVPDAKIIHLEGKSFVNTRRRETFFLQSRQKYYSLTHGRLYQYLISKFYYSLTWAGFKLSAILNDRMMERKLSQRLSILKELQKTVSDK